MSHAPEILTDPVELDPAQHLVTLEPKLVDHFVPLNGEEQKAAFLSGQVRNPNHVYDEVDNRDFDAAEAELVALGEEIAHDPNVSPKFKPAYKTQVDSYLSRNNMLRASHDFKHAATQEERQSAKERYMQKNVEQYGEPSETTYRSLLNEKLTAIAAKELTGQAETLRQELFALANYDPSVTHEVAPRFKPSAETVEWANTVVNTLFGGMLSHVPEQETFTRDEVAAVFSTILTEEFGDAASDWQVISSKGASVNVRAKQKCIVVPEGLKDQSANSVKNLVVHEIGVHALRSIMGYQTDFSALAVGIPGYYDHEEGFGLVAEQARQGVFKEPAPWHYIAAGGAYFDGRDFRDVFEMRWRMAALEKLKDGETLDAASIDEERGTAYKGTMRIFRGTDELPWFKDLAYYNGQMSVWQHLEAIRGDDLKLTFMFLGKADATSIDHERLMYETNSEPVPN